MNKLNFVKHIATTLMITCIGTLFSFPVLAAETESSSVDEKYTYVYTIEVENGEIMTASSVNGNVVIDSPLKSGVMNVSAKSRRVGFSFLISGSSGTGTITFKKGNTQKKVLVNGSSVLTANGKYFEGNFGSNPFDNYLTSGNWTVVISCTVPFLCSSISVAS